MFFYIILLFCAQTTVWGQDDYTERANRYIEQHKNLAILEQQRSGVPAAITLAQGILETAAGNSELMTQANNHFGIKCRKEWQGETFSHDDDAPNECFRKYSCAQESYKDHSDYLRTGPRYAALFQLSPTDYSGWANGLKRCGYATNPRYAQQLIKIIEDFHLQDYTYLAMSKARTSAPVAVAVVPAQTTNKATQNNTPTDNSQAATTTVEQPAKQEAPKSSDTHDDGKVTMVNGLRAFHAHKGDVLLEKAIKYNVRYARLLEINDLPDAPLEADMFIYLEKKNSKGIHSTHVMQQGETLLQVAQAEGVQLKQIRSFNQLGSNETPVVGTILHLQEPTSRKPELVASNTPMTSSPVVRSQNDEQTVYFFKKSSSNTPKKVEPVKEVTRPVAAAPQVTKPVEKPVETPPAPVTKPAETAATTPQVTKLVEAPPAPVTKPAEIVETTPQVNNTVATKETAANTPKTEEVNIANEKAVEEEMEGEEPVDTETVAAKPEEEPQDELSRLKRKLDKAVYGKNEQRPSKSNINTTEADKPIASANPTTTPETSKTTADGSKIYIVQKGDTAFNIAKRFNITMRQLMDWNNLNFQAIKPGMKLRVKQ